MVNIKIIAQAIVTISGPESDTVSSTSADELRGAITKRRRLHVESPVGGLDQLINLSWLNLSSNQLTGKLFCITK